MQINSKVLVGSIYWWKWGIEAIHYYKAPSLLLWPLVFALWTCDIQYLMYLFTFIIYSWWIIIFINYSNIIIFSELVLSVPSQVLGYYTSLSWASDCLIGWTLSFYSSLWETSSDTCFLEKNKFCVSILSFCLYLFDSELKSFYFKVTTDRYLLTHASFGWFAHCLDY